jgi:hypothetical protein
MKAIVMVSKAQVVCPVGRFMDSLILKPPDIVLRLSDFLERFRVELGRWGLGGRHGWGKNAQRGYQSRPSWVWGHTTDGFH